VFEMNVGETDGRTASSWFSRSVRGRSALLLRGIRRTGTLARLARDGQECPSYFFACLIFLLITPLAHAAAPTVDYLYPAGVPRGRTTTVTASGQLAPWPVSIWTDRPGITIGCGEKAGELEIEVAPDAPCGVGWFRLFNGEGATPPKPLVIGALPEALEEEPNDAPDAAPVVEQPVTVNGRLEKNGDVDGYAVHLASGQTLVASLLANRVLSSPMDGVLQVCDPDGFVLDQVDDECGLDPQLVFVAPREGNYLIRTFAFPTTPNSSIAFAGGASFVYRLTLTAGPFVDHAFPLAIRGSESTDLELGGWNIPADAAQQIASAEQGRGAVDVFRDGWASALQLPIVPHDRLPVADEPNDAAAPLDVEIPAVISGRIDAAGDVDAFRFAARDGQRITFRAESRGLDYALDPLLELLDSEGKSLARVDDAGKEADPALTHQFRADGSYRLLIRDAFDHGGPRHVYRVTIEETRPDFALKLSADAFALQVGKHLEIPVTIERQNGFAEEIEIRAIDLPEGVGCEPVVSAKEGDSAKSVKLKLTCPSGPTHSGPFRIVGIAKGNPPIEQTAEFPLTGISHHRTLPWLTVRAM